MSTHPELRRSLAARLAETSGVTLVELIISITIVGIAVTGTLLSINRSVRSSADPLVVHQALVVAEAYLEEILLNDYYDPDLGAVGGVCPAQEASRDLYDNVCDYDLLADVGARDQDNNALPGLGRYTITVTVETANANLDTLNGPTQVIRVDVNATDGAIVDFTLSGYRTNY